MCEVHVSACTCGGQGGLLSDQTMEVTGSSRVAFFSFIFLSLSLYLSLSFSSRLPSQPPPLPWSPRRIGQRPRQGGWGRYRGPRGCRGRRPRAPAPPRSSQARPARARTPAAAENDRRLGGRLKRLRAVRPRGSAERGGGGGGPLARRTRAPRAAMRHAAQPGALGGRITFVVSGSL